LHPADLFELIRRHLAIDKAEQASVYNVGGGVDVSVSLAELTEVCREIVGRSVPVTSDAGTAAVDVPLYISDYSRIASLTGWRPERGVETIISDIFSWIRQNESELRGIFI
jgi:CDP-paratose 2-epimerase